MPYNLCNLYMLTQALPCEHIAARRKPSIKEVTAEPSYVIPSEAGIPSFSALPGILRYRRKYHSVVYLLQEKVAVLYRGILIK